MGSAQLGAGLARARRANAACSIFFFETKLFSLFQKQNKDNFCLKTPNEFKLVSKILHKQNTLNKTHTLGIFEKLK